MKVGLTCQDLFQFCKVVSTGPSCQTYKKPTGWKDWPRLNTDLALPVCKIPADQVCFVSYGDASGGSTRAEQAQAGFVIMFADVSLLAGLAASVTLASWKSHRVKRVVASASAAEAMRRLHTLSRIRTGNYDHLHNETIGPSEDRRSAIDLATIREDLSRPQMFLRWVDGKAQVADALTKLHCDGDLLRAVCRQAFTVFVEASEIMAARRQEGENVKGYRESSHH